MKTLKKSTIVIGILSVIYVVSSIVFSHTGLSYRMWVSALGGLLTLMVFPLLLLVVAGAWLFRKLPIHRMFKVMIGVLAAGAYVLWFYFAILLLAFSTNTEKKLTDDLLIVNYGFLDPYYAYYKPFGLILRLPTDLTDEDREAYLEEKYHTDFCAAGEALLASKEHPDIMVSAYVSNMEFQDNYVEAVAGKYLAEAMESLGISRNYYIDKDNMGRAGWLYMELKGEEDIPQFAEDASKVIQYTIEKTDFWKEQRGVLCFYSGEEAQRITGSLPFGRLNQWDTIQADYYLDTEQIAERVSERYQKQRDFLAELEADRLARQESMQNAATWDSGISSGTGSFAENAASGEQINEVERAALAVYDTVLASEGYICQICYNAKGNLYLDLGRRPVGEPEDKSVGGSYQFILTYDRVSKNGACQLFVLNKVHLSEDGVNDGTAILDIYAVETATGNVIASGKQSWEDVGSEAYREATGE